MVVSDELKYIFLETPHTGSTAISKELVENYEGKTILNKHDNYRDFLKVASPEQKKYYVFAGVRNPLDEAVSLYNKFLTNHKGNFTDESKLIKNGGWVGEKKISIYKMVQNNKDFAMFIEQYYPKIYTSNININKRYCSHIIKLENIDTDFTAVLKELGVQPKRKLPVTNKTMKKEKSTKDYFKGKTSWLAAKRFSPFMREWGYKLPEGWLEPSWADSTRYWFTKKLRIAYALLIKSGPLKKASFIRDRVE